MGAPKNKKYMAQIAIFNLTDRIKGNTFNAVTFHNFTINEIPIDYNSITEVDIVFSKGSNTGREQVHFSIANGISLNVSEKSIVLEKIYELDWNVDTYYYDVKLTFSTEKIKTFVKGSVKVIQNIS